MTQQISSLKLMILIESWYSGYNSQTTYSSNRSLYSLLFFNGESDFDRLIVFRTKVIKVSLVVIRARYDTLSANNNDWVISLIFWYPDVCSIVYKD